MPSTQTPQDAWLRRQLTDAPVPPPPPGGWDRLRRHLDADPDAGLRKKLTGLADGTTPSGWNDLERRLDPAAAADDHIRRQLTKIPPRHTSPSAGAWEAFLLKYEDELGQRVDAVVAERISADVSRPPSGWAQLAARLELVRDRRARLLAGAITELSLVASLLLLFLRFLPGGEPELAAFRLDLADPTGGVHSKISPPIAETTELPAPELTAVARQITDKDRVEPSRLVVEDKSDGAIPVSTGIAPSLVQKTPNRVGPLSLPVREGGVSKLLASRNHDVAILPLVTEVPEVHRALTMPQPALRLPPAFDATVEPLKVYLNAFASPVDINHIVTPEQAILDLDVIADSRLTQGFSVGLLVDLERGNSGIEFGAIVNRMSYIPTALKWFAQDEFPLLEPVKGYSRFRYENLNLPFTFTHTLVGNDRWRLSAQATTQVSIVTRSTFYVPDGGRQAIVDAFNDRAERAQQLAALQGGFTSGQGRNLTDYNPQTIINPPEGWWQGGTFFDNATFYLGGGLRVERSISPRTSIYFSPSFGRAIYFDSVEGGLGPYRDRLHLGQLRFGGRIRL